MPDGGILTVRAENQYIAQENGDTGFGLKAGDYVHISFEDKGRGIPKAHLSKLFDPYFSTKPMGVQKGMGLGLATAHAIVKKHGGHIKVQSTSDVGTTVNIYLPASADAQSQQARQAGHPAERAESQAHGAERNETETQSAIQRILVMDDEEMLRNLAEQMLNRLGYEVETVKDGIEAIEVYKKQLDSVKPFDAVILDLTVKGGMGGEETLKELMKIDPDVKAIVASGYFNDPVMADFQDYGFDAAIAKPYEMKDLKQALEKLLG
jgi:CheY-like chemotaxis protein